MAMMTELKMKAMRTLVRTTRHARRDATSAETVAAIAEIITARVR